MLVLISLLLLLHTAKYCTNTDSLENGQTLSCPNGNYYGFTCQFQCNDGYYPLLNNTECLHDMTWTIKNMTCEGITWFVLQMLYTLICAFSWF